MKKYSKLIVAGIGFILLVLNQFFGIEISIGAKEILDFAIPILSLTGLWAVPTTAGQV